VKRISETVQVCLVTVGGDVYVEGVVATAMRLDGRAADDDELHIVIDQSLQERFALSVDRRVHATGVCWLSHSAILSPAARSSVARGASRSRWTSSTA
jgi:hypothetical protein